MIATRNNMERCEAAGLRVVAVCPDTGETYSATSGDYWFMPGDEPLVGQFDEPCYLGVRMPEYREVTESDLGVKP